MRCLAGVLLTAVTAVGCGGDGSGGSSAHVRVFAASSLTDAFEEIGAAFEDGHDGVRVDFAFAASSQLVAQIDAGAPASVLATADEQTMADAVAARHAREPQVFARNRLALAVEAGNPAGIDELADLDAPDLLFALCAEEAPCGRLGALALARAGVARTPTTYGESARAVLTAVELGEVDAGIVYVTDVRTADGDVDAVELELAGDPSLEARYPIATLAGAVAREESEAFVAFVRSDAGQSILRAHGFLPA